MEPNFAPVQNCTPMTMPQIKTSSNETTTKTPEQKEDGDAKLGKALLGLAAIAAGGIAIYKGRGKIAKLFNKSAVKVENAASQTAQTASEKAAQQLNEAKTMVLDGKRYKLAKKHSTRNLPKQLKAENKEEMRKVLENTRKRQAATTAISKNAHEVSVSAKKNIHISKCNITSKTPEGLNQQLQASAMAVQQAKEAQETAQTVYDKLGTRKAKQNLQRANNVVAETKAEAKRIKAKVEDGLTTLKQPKGKPMTQVAQNEKTIENTAEKLVKGGNNRHRQIAKYKSKYNL